MASAAHGRGRQRASLDDDVERLAVDVLLDEIELRLGPHRIDERGDARVGQCAQRVDLALEQVDGFPGVYPIEGELLDHDARPSGAAAR